MTYIFTVLEIHNMILYWWWKCLTVTLCVTCRAANWILTVMTVCDDRLAIIICNIHLVNEIVRDSIEIV